MEWFAKKGGGCGEGGHDSPTFDSNIFTCLLICRKIFFFWWNCEKKVMKVDIIDVLQLSYPPPPPWLVDIVGGSRVPLTPQLSKSYNISPFLNNIMIVCEDFSLLQNKFSQIVMFTSLIRLKNYMNTRQRTSDRRLEKGECWGTDRIYTRILTYIHTTSIKM